MEPSERERESQSENPASPRPGLREASEMVKYRPPVGSSGSLFPSLLPSLSPALCLFWEAGPSEGGAPLRALPPPPSTPLLDHLGPSRIRQLSSVHPQALQNPGRGFWSEFAPRRVRGALGSSRPSTGLANVRTRAVSPLQAKSGRSSAVVATPCGRSKQRVVQLSFSARRPKDRDSAQCALLEVKMRF